MNILEIESVNKSFGSRHIIRNLTVSVKEKSIVALVGDSGSGKSTILNMIGLLEDYDNGIIRINGTKIPGINSRKATLIRRNMINYLFQSFALINDMTIAQNLLISMEFVDKSKRDKNHMIDKILEELDMIHLKDAKINTLSGGEQQRVALARCILKPGDLILADEPTGSLDKHMADIAFNLIKDLRDKYGKTVIIVTHDMSLVEKVDRVIEISKYNVLPMSPSL